MGPQKQRKWRHGATAGAAGATDTTRRRSRKEERPDFFLWTREYLVKMTQKIEDRGSWEM